LEATMFAESWHRLLSSAGPQRLREPALGVVVPVGILVGAGGLRSGRTMTLLVGARPTWIEPSPSVPQDGRIAAALQTSASCHRRGAGTRAGSGSMLTSA